MASSNGDMWLSDIKTLDQVKSLGKFPSVVKINETTPKLTKHNDSHLAKDSVLFLETVATPVFVKVKVIDYQDSKQAERDYGKPFVQQHHSLVNSKHYLPTTYRGDLIQHYRKRYQNVSEVLQEMPESVEVLKRFLVPSEDRSSRTEVVPGTVLTVTGVRGDKGQRVLCCIVRDTGQPLDLKEPCPLCCKAVSTGKRVKLQDILATNALPQKVTFERVESSVMLASDRYDINTLTCIVSGPVEVLSCDSFVMYICRTRDALGEKKVSYNTLLLPLAIAREQRVVLPKRPVALLRHFFPSLDLESDHEEKLYAIRAEVIEKEGKHLQSGLIADVDILNGPAPPVPPRQGVTRARAAPTTQEKQGSAMTGYLRQVKQKCELGFGKVHAELLSMVQKRLGSSEPTGGVKGQEVGKSPGLPPPGLKKEARRSVPNRYTPIRHTSWASKGSGNKGRLLPEPPPETGDGTGVVYDCIEDDVMYEEVKETTPAGKYDDLTQPAMYEDVTKPAPRRTRSLAPIDLYEPVGVQDRGASNLALGNSHSGQPALEFFDYSVDELANCLQQCGFGQLADTCRSESLDGDFFKISKESELMEEPFRMTVFTLKKLGKVIDGWRPKK